MSRVMLISVIFSFQRSVLHAKFLGGGKYKKSLRFNGITRLNIELIYWVEKERKSSRFDLRYIPEQFIIEVIQVLLVILD